MIVIAIVTGIALAGIYISLCWLFPSCMVDVYRQNMFALRDEWFDYAASGDIDFEHPVYRILRTTMNTRIRYAHRSSLGTLLCWLLMKPHDLQEIDVFRLDRKLDASMLDLHPSTQEVARNVLEKMDRLEQLHSSDWIPLAEFIWKLRRASVRLIRRLAEIAGVCSRQSRTVWNRADYVAALDHGDRFLASLAKR